MLVIVALLMHLRIRWRRSRSGPRGRARPAAMGAVAPACGRRRTNKFTAAFSDAMDIIVRGIKSGLPVHDCLKIIARETPQPLAGEFTRLVENIGMGMSLDQALDNGSTSTCRRRKCASSRS